MDLKKFITDSQKKYFLRLKTVVPLEDKQMDRIERVVAKYNPISISRPKKTILQKNPLDFDREVENAEVWMVDMVFGMPADPIVIREDIRKALDAPTKYVVVRTQNDPTEIETLRLNAIDEINEEAKKRNLVPDGLLNQMEYIEGDGNSEDGTHLFGNEYNNAFLFHLNKIRDERRDSKVKTDNALFNFLNMPKRENQEPVQDDVDFNAHISGAPKVKPKESDVKIKIPDTSIMGNKNDQTRVISKVFRDENGNKVVISRTFGDLS
jgi:hypothetical protein